MHDPGTIGSARPDEWTDAFALALQQVPDADRPARLANALALLAAGDIDPRGIFVARSESGLAGVQVCIPLAGASGLFWLPQVRERWRDTDLADRLVHAALAWLRERGVKVAQALIHPQDLPGAAPLLRGGFRRVTQLQYLCHDLEEIPTEPSRPGLRMEPYTPAHAELFHQTLARTYEDTFDCPELNGVRTIDEIIAGHRTQGIWRPETWWLAFADDQPVGIVMLMELFERNGWDLTYLGLVEGCRGQGLGRALTLQALHALRHREAARLLVAVDRRNTPALGLYESVGFEPTEVREVFLCIFQAPQESANRAASV